jgi:hypothetical protein
MDTDKHGFFTEGNKGNNGSLTQTEIMDGTGTAEYTEYAEGKRHNHERHFQPQMDTDKHGFFTEGNKGKKGSLREAESC